MENRWHIESGDFVIDPMDGELRQVAEVRETSILMVDGGIMGLGENFQVLLPSEAAGYVADDPR